MCTRFGVEVGRQLQSQHSQLVQSAGGPNVSARRLARLAPTLEPARLFAKIMPTTARQRQADDAHQCIEAVGFSRLLDRRSFHDESGQNCVGNSDRCTDETRYSDEIKPPRNSHLTASAINMANTKSDKSKQPANHESAPCPQTRSDSSAGYSTRRTPRARREPCSKPAVSIETPNHGSWSRVDINIWY